MRRCRASRRPSTGSSTRVRRSSVPEAASKNDASRNTVSDDAVSDNGALEEVPPRALAARGAAWTLQRGPRRWRRYSPWMFYAFVSPWLLGFLALTAIPMFYALGMSFTNFDGLSGHWHWVGFANYTKAWHDPHFWSGLRTTAVYGVVTVPLSLAGGLGLAVLVNRRLRAVGVFRTIFYLPSVIPVVATTLMFKLLFDRNTGLLNTVLSWFGVGAVGWLSDPWAFKIMVLLALWGLGGGMVIFLAGLQGIPAELLEAATVDGAGAWQRFRRITLPILSPVGDERRRHDVRHARGPAAQQVPDVHGADPARGAVRRARGLELPVLPQVRGRVGVDQCPPAAAARSMGHLQAGAHSDRLLAVPVEHAADRCPLRDADHPHQRAGRVRFRAAARPRPLRAVRPDAGYQHGAADPHRDPDLCAVHPDSPGQHALAVGAVGTGRLAVPGLPVPPVLRLTPS